MPLAIKSMPNGYLVGTRTWGATGPRWGDTSPAVTHDGSFSGNKLWLNVTEAGWQTKGPNFESYEGIGITPDDVVEFDWNEFYNGGKDKQLEAAITHIRDRLP
jgi:C-terminal processing protease CtpA/Prc